MPKCSLVATRPAPARPGGAKCSLVATRAVAEMVDGTATAERWTSGLAAAQLSTVTRPPS
jgi:hypothetical protein